MCVPACVTWPLYRPPTCVRKGQRPSSSLEDPKAQRSYVTCPRPLSIVSGIQEFCGLVPLNTRYMAGPILVSRNAKVCALKDANQL